MSLEEHRTRLADQAYRVVALTNVDQDLQLGHEQLTTPGTDALAVDYDGAVSDATINTLPSHIGLAQDQQQPESEHWKQVYADQSADGFKVLAYIRQNPNGTTYQDAQGRAQTIITFPGSSGTPEDQRMSADIVAGKEMYHLCKQTQDAISAISAELRDNHLNGATPDIVIGAHSQGGFAATGAAVEIAQYFEGATIDTVKLESFADGLALEQWAVYRTAQDRYDADNLSAAQIDRIEIDQDQVLPIRKAVVQNGIDMQERTSSITSDDPTYPNSVHVGGDTHNNRQTGDTWTYISPDSDDWYGGAKDRATDHLLVSMHESFLTHGSRALDRTEEDDLTTHQILIEGQALNGIEQLLAQIKTALLSMLQSMFGDFNNSAKRSVTAAPTPAQQSSTSPAQNEPDNNAPDNNNGNGNEDAPSAPTPADEHTPDQEPATPPPATIGAPTAGV